MRDPNRIFPMMNKIAALWQEKVPDWRFGQLMCNFFDTFRYDPFYTEDEEFLKKFENFLQSKENEK